MSDLRGTILNLTKNVTKSSGDLLRTTKLTVSLANEQELLKGVYIEIGKKVHEIYMYGGTLGKFFDEKYKDIAACEQKINVLKEQISQIKGTRECPKCGKVVEKTAEFCPKCGNRLDGSARTEEVHVPETRTPEISASEAGTRDVEPSDVDVGPIPTAAPSESEEPSEVTLPEPQPKRTCGICGAVNDDHTKFCLTCGRILSK